MVVFGGTKMTERKIILYISQSLDGYIADNNKSVDWIAGENQEHYGDYGYNHFIKNIDTIILGNNTYKQIATELSPDEWVYKGLTSYVFTNEKSKDTDDIKFINEDIISFIEKLKKQKGKNIWICGGANIANQCINKNIIDEYRITTIPILLGRGIRLFNENNPQIKLSLKKVKKENGLIECIYVKR